MAVKWYTYFNTTKPNSPITVGGLIFLALTLFLLLLKLGVLWNLVKIQKSFDTALNQNEWVYQIKINYHWKILTSLVSVWEPEPLSIKIIFDTQKI